MSRQLCNLIRFTRIKIFHINKKSWTIAGPLCFKMFFCSLQDLFSIKMSHSKINTFLKESNYINISRMLLQVYFIFNSWAVDQINISRDNMIKYINEFVYDFVLSHSYFCNTRLLDDFVLHLLIPSTQRILCKRTAFVYVYCQYMCTHFYKQSISYPELVFNMNK